MSPPYLGENGTVNDAATLRLNAKSDTEKADERFRVLVAGWVYTYGVMKQIMTPIRLIFPAMNVTSQFWNFSLDDK